MTHRITITLDPEIFLDAAKHYPVGHPVRERVFDALVEVATGGLRHHTGARLQFCGIAVEEAILIPNPRT